MKKLSDFQGEKGIEISSDILGIILEILADSRNAAQDKETSPIKMFTAFSRNSPKEMMKIFAILSEKDPETYTCNAAEAMENLLILSDDAILRDLFMLQGQMGDAQSSASVTENIKD